jgi:hypothetical protein
MFATAVANVTGVGAEYDEAKTSPTTWSDVENTPVDERVSWNPVKKVAAAGLTPMFPVMAEEGTVEIPV